MARNSSTVSNLGASDKPKEVLDATLGGSVPSEEKESAVRVFESYGWNMSTGVRTLCRVFVESAAVRDEVLAHLHRRVA